MSSTGAEKRYAVTRWMADQGVRDPEQVSQEEYAELMSLLAPHKGFGIFLSIIMFERQQAAALLNNLNFATPQGASTGSQLQGTIKAIDTIREIVLNIADPVGDRSEAPNQKQE